MAEHIRKEFQATLNIASRTDKTYPNKLTIRYSLAVWVSEVYRKSRFVYAFTLIHRFITLQGVGDKQLESIEKTITKTSILYYHEYNEDKCVVDLKG